MRKILVLFAIPILVSNILFIYVGFVANVGFVGSFAGGLMAIGTDPIIIMIGIILGIMPTVFKLSNISLIYLILGAILSTVVIHFILGTKNFIIDVIRFDALRIISSNTILVASSFSPRTKDTKTKININTDPSKHREVRLLVLIFSAALFGFLLFSDQTNINNKITHTVVGKYITKPIIKEFHKDENGYLRGNYRHSMWIAHTIIFIILMAIVFIFRFHITHKLLSLTRLADVKPVKTKSSVPKSIRKFFKNL